MCAASPTSASRSPMNARAVNSPSGKARRGPIDFDVAELQAETFFQLGVKFIVGQRDDALGLARVFGPHDRRAFARQRQNREWPGRQEMLLGAAVVIALVRDRRDDRRLIVIPAMRGDAGLFADLRARAVGADQQPRRHRFAIGELRPRSHSASCSKSGDRAGAQIDAESLSPSPPAHRPECRFSIMCANGSPSSTSPPKVRNVGRTASSSLLVGHHHVEDRLRVVRDRVPDLDRLEQPPRGGGDRRGARVLRLRARQRGVDDRHRERLPSP